MCPVRLRDRKMCIIRRCGSSTPHVTRRAAQNVFVVIQCRFTDMQAEADRPALICFPTGFTSSYASAFSKQRIFGSSQPHFSGWGRPFPSSEHVLLHRLGSMGPTGRGHWAGLRSARSVQPVRRQRTSSPRPDGEASPSLGSHCRSERRSGGLVHPEGIAVCLRSLKAQLILKFS